VVSVAERLAPGARRVLRAMVLGIAASVAVTALSRLGALSGWETRAVDAFLFFRDRVPSPELALVAIDEEAFQALGERQPLPRRYLAELGDFLLRSGARVVAFDVVLRARSDPKEDEALIAMTRGWDRAGPGRLVFAALAMPRKAVGPERYDASRPFSPDLRGSFGFTNAPLGEDGMIRRMAPVLPAGDGGHLPSFALTVVAAYAGHTRNALDRMLAGGGDLPLPVRAAGASPLAERAISLPALSAHPWRIDFAGPPGTFTTFPSGPLVGMARRRVDPAPDNPFRGRIVLVGATFQESRDFYPTPVGLMPGVEIQAHMVHTLLTRRVGQPPHWALNLSLLVGACVTVAVLSVWLRPVWLLLACLGLVAGLATVSYEAYIRGGYWLDFVAPLVGMEVYIQGSRFLARRRLRSAFGQFVSPKVVDRVLREGTALGGTLRTVSVLLSDLRGFTGLSERLPLDRISEMLNEYFTGLVEVIAARGGMVVDFIGDGMLAVFGAPTDDPEHAWHAVATALEMQAALAQLNQRWRREGRPPLTMGVAVHTGEVFAGNVGSPQRKKYAVLGDTVNTVSRIEGLNRDLGTAILISGAALAAVKDRVVVRDRGPVAVKGRTQPVELFELLGLCGEVEAPSGR
jgi:adenylate cyclase